MKRILLFALGLWLSSPVGFSQISSKSHSQNAIPAAEVPGAYLHLLKGKRIAVFANQTSRVGNRHLVDTLLASKILIKKIFSPEHGFRGTADAGEKVTNGMDSRTGLPVISLYGDRKKPKASDLADIDIVLFDIQDVGARFYTYISSLQYVMEACFENGKQLIVLDRPNPNGWYIDGPVLKKSCKSFVGMQPIPIVYGMTMGEYALMIAGEKWLETEKSNIFYAKAANKTTKGKNNSALIIIPCRQYDHDTKYRLPVFPSPNLREMSAVYLYPSTCLFEGTLISEGRGTEKPFQIFGHPLLPDSLYAFTPAPNFGAQSGKCFYQKCYGWNESGTEEEILKKINGKINLRFVINAYHLFPGKDSFFIKNNFCQKAGNEDLMTQIRSGMPESEIRKSWMKDIEAFKKIRKKYLLYKDFTVK